MHYVAPTEASVRIATRLVCAVCIASVWATRRARKQWRKRHEEECLQLAGAIDDRANHLFYCAQCSVRGFRLAFAPAQQRSHGR